MPSKYVLLTRRSVGPVDKLFAYCNRGKHGHRWTCYELTTAQKMNKCEAVQKQEIHGGEVVTLKRAEEIIAEQRYG